MVFNWASGGRGSLASPGVTGARGERRYFRRTSLSPALNGDAPPPALKATWRPQCPAARHRSSPAQGEAHLGVSSLGASQCPGTPRTLSSGAPCCGPLSLLTLVFFGSIPPPLPPPPPPVADTLTCSLRLLPAERTRPDPQDPTRTSCELCQRPHTPPRRAFFFFFFPRFKVSWTEWAENGGGSAPVPLCSP